MRQIKHRSQLGEVCELGYAVEVGCAEGLFSLDLLKMGFSRLYMVDNYATIPNQKGDGGFPQDFHDRNEAAAVKRIYEHHFEDRVHLLKGMSDKMAEHIEDESMSLVYLDGNHSYKGVIVDLFSWWPKLKVGGVMAGHDYLAPQYGVFQAVQEFFKNRESVFLIPEDRDEDAGFYVIKK